MVYSTRHKKVFLPKTSTCRDGTKPDGNNTTTRPHGLPNGKQVLVHISHTIGTHSHDDVTSVKTIVQCFCSVVLLSSLSDVAVLPLAHAHTVTADTSRLLISSFSLDAWHSYFWMHLAVVISELPGYPSRWHAQRSCYVTAEFPCEAISTIDQNFTISNK